MTFQRPSEECLASSLVRLSLFALASAGSVEASMQSDRPFGTCVVAVWLSHAHFLVMGLIEVNYFPMNMSIKGGSFEYLQAKPRLGSITWTV